MGSLIEDILLGIGSFLLGKDKINKIVIGKLVTRGRSRPHPWTTRCGHICWSGLTDRSYNARLLPPKPHLGPEGPGTARPPLDQTASLFAADPAGQRPCPKSTCLFPAFSTIPPIPGSRRTLFPNMASARMVDGLIRA